MSRNSRCSVRRFRRRPRRFHFAIADLIADGADSTAPDAGRLEDRREQIRRRGLAVGAGDADEDELAARVAEELRRQRRQREPCV